MQMDRLLAPTRPFNTVLRPGDGKIPERIAYILCTGSRDETVDNPLCSRFCCMYSIKQNQLIMGALPLADVTVHYMDIRAPGKRYDEFYEGAKSMGATYVKGRVAKITEKPDGNLILRYEDIEHGGAIVEAEYDMVVLAIGVQPNREVERLFSGEAIELNDYHYVAEPNEDIDPGRTNIPGVFVAGTASGAKDIADSILHAGAAVAQVAAHLGERVWSRSQPPDPDLEGAGMSDMQPSARRIGVYVCHCGGNISDYVDVQAVVDAVKDEPGVVVAKHMMFACSDAGQQEMEQDIEEQNLDGLVVASCSPKLHVVTFRGVAKRAGLNPYEYSQANIREQCSWTHTDDHEGATRKAIGLVRGVIARTRLTEALEPLVVETTQKALIIGGGITGLRAAIGMADIGLGVFLVEREPELGGWVGKFGPMFPHEREGRELIAHLVEEVKKRPAINVFTGAEVVTKAGSFGNYQVGIRVSADPPETISAEVGSIIVATGFDAYQPADGELGTGLDGVITLPEFKELVDGSKGKLRYNGRPVRSLAYILLRRQPAAGRQRVLLALLLLGHRPRLDQGFGAGPEGPPVPPLSRHPDLRQLRAALHRGPQAGRRLREVPRRRAAGYRRRGGRRSGRDGPRPSVR